VRELVRRYQADVRALAEARRRGPRAPSLAQEAQSPTEGRSPKPLSARPGSGGGNAKSPRFGAAIGAAQLYAGKETDAGLGFLDWTEEAPQSVLNMAHPAVMSKHAQHAQHFGAGLQAEESDEEGQEVEQPVAWSLRMHAPSPSGGGGSVVAGTRPRVRQFETEPLSSEMVPGWLPPLPPPGSAEGQGSQQATWRNGSAGSRSSVGSLSARSSRPSRVPSAEQQRSPTTKSLRAPQQPADQEDHSAASLATGNRSARHSYDASSSGGGGGSQRGYERKSQQQSGGGGGAGASSLHRANKASNVLSSMSTFLSREVVASTSPRDRAPLGADTFRI
jgi:hypothetical protein